MINSVNKNQIQNLLIQQALNNNTKPADAPAAQDDQLQADFAGLIDKAINSDIQNDTDAVQQAKKLLESGQLDNIENIRKAAENIIDLGI